MKYLDEVEVGKYRVVSLPQGHRCKQQLNSFGLVEDSIVEVIQVNRFCPIIINVRGSVIAIGRCRAHCIGVESIVH